MRHLVLTGLAVLLLAGCDRGSDQPFTDSRTPPALGPQFWAPPGWTWGVVPGVEGPAIRYGVSGPPHRASRHAVLLADYGQPAEAYFETARALNGRGYLVWVLEAQGQGGSGRFPGPRDVGRSAGFDRDAEALRQLMDQVVRPAAEQEVVIVAPRAAALTALLSLQGGLRHVDRMVLDRPDFEPEGREVLARALTTVGLGMVRAEGRGWKRPTGDLTGRSTLPQAWQTANPDLRIGGPGWSWVAARAEALSAASPQAMNKARVPIVMRAGARTGAAGVCAAVSSCRVAGEARGAPHLSGAAVFNAWIDLIAPPVPAAEPDHVS